MPYTGSAPGLGGGIWRRVGGPLACGAMSLAGELELLRVRNGDGSFCSNWWDLSRDLGWGRGAVWIELGMLGSGCGNFGLLLRVAFRMGILDCYVPLGGVIASGWR